MPPQTVLACLTDEAGAPLLARAAATLSEAWGARLIGLHVMEGLVLYPSFRVGVPDAVHRGLGERQQAHVARLEAAFAEATRDLGARAQWRTTSAGDGLVSDRVVECARAADIVLMGTAGDGAEAYQQRFLQEAVIRGGGRPVLVVPRGAGIGGADRAVAGWRDTAEATRAVHDLAPLLAPGAALRLVSFGEGPRPGGSGGVLTELTGALARHGLDVEIERRPDPGIPISEALEDEARAFGADLLAVGAYGHSRAYDLILGAVSRDLLRRTRMPVLLSR